MYAFSVQENDNGTHDDCIPYSPISVAGFWSVATVSIGFQLRLKVATDLKPETEIGVYGTCMVPYSYNLLC